MPDRTQPITLQLGPANTGLTLSLALLDTAGNAVSGASFAAITAGPNAGDYYTSVTHPDTFAGGFVVVTNTAGPTAIARFAIGAASLLPSAVQTSTTITVSPLLALSNQPAFARRDITVAQHSTNAQRWIIVDSTKSPRDLSGKTLRFVVGQESGGAFNTRFAYTLGTDDEITLEGDDNNQPQVSPASDDNDTAGTFTYWLWNTTDNELLVTGAWIVQAANLE